MGPPSTNAPAAIRYMLFLAGGRVKRPQDRPTARLAKIMTVPVRCGSACVVVVHVWCGGCAYAVVVMVPVRRGGARVV